MSRLSILMLLCFAGSVLAQDGRLESVRSEVRTPKLEAPSSPSSSSGSNPSDHSSSCIEGDEDLNKLGAYAIFYVVTSPFTIPVALVGDDYRLNAVFIAYPYAEKWDGLMQRGRGETVDGVHTPYSWDRLLSVRAAAEAGTDFSGVNRLGLSFLVDTMTRFGIGGSVQFFEEDKRALETDRLAIGDINALFRFAQSQRWQYRAGIGMRFMDDKNRTDLGINFVYGWEWFPKEPYTFSAQLEAGTLGNATVFRATGRMGLVWKHAEAYAGYDYLRIGSTDLQGPMIGLRLWF